MGWQPRFERVTQIAGINSIRLAKATSPLKAQKSVTGLFPETNDSFFFYILQQTKIKFETQLLKRYLTLRDESGLLMIVGVLLDLSLDKSRTCKKLLSHDLQSAWVEIRQALLSQFSLQTFLLMRVKVNDKR
jgi:hypothetical protein